MSTLQIPTVQAWHMSRGARRRPRSPSMAGVHGARYSYGAGPAPARGHGWVSLAGAHVDAGHPYTTNWAADVTQVTYAGRVQSEIGRAIGPRSTVMEGDCQRFGEDALKTASWAESVIIRNVRRGAALIKGRDVDSVPEKRCLHNDVSYYCGG